MSLTSSTHGARDHARAQAGARAESQPTIPAGGAAHLPPGVDRESLIWEETLAAGGHCSHRLPRGARLRLLDRDGDACAALMVHNAAAPAERLNVADTVKVQWQAYLGPRMLLLSDMGRVLMTLEEDTSARHDALCGVARPGRDLLLLALAKQGLGRRDLPGVVNLFKGVRVEGDGSLAFAGDPAPGAHVTLRAEVDVVVCLANVAHRLDRRAGAPCSPLRLTAWQGPPTPGDDPLRAATPEGLRAFQNTDDHLLGLGVRP